MKRVEEILMESGALLEGHFLLTSGRHGGKYMQCAKVLQCPEYAGEIAAAVVASFGDSLGEVDLVIAPAVGGIVFGYELARQMGVKSLFAERESGKMTLRRGFEILPEQRVLVAEDVVTTGGSVREVIELVRGLGGEVAGVALMVDRSGGAAASRLERNPVCIRPKLPARRIQLIDRNPWGR